MVISAQMRLGGFYAWVTRGIAACRSVAAGAARGADRGGRACSSAVFSNDVVCLAMAPVLVDMCLRRRL